MNTMQRHISGQPLSIGRPTPNNRVYILDENLQQTAVGQSGTMWAGGKGISRGYVGQPELTRSKYLPDKFANDGFVFAKPLDARPTILLTANRSRMYNTGDMGLWNPDGSIKINGRCDDQVKIKVSTPNSLS